MTSYNTPDKKGETGEGQNILWSPDYTTPENAIILRRNVPVDVQNEDRFSPRNTFAFNPFAQEWFSTDNGVLVAFLFMLAKKDPKSVERLAARLMANVTSMLNAVIATGKSHPITALNATTTWAVLAHRFGILDDSHYLKISDQTRHIIDTLQQLSAAGIAMDGLQVFAEAGTGIAKMSNLKSLKP